MENLVEIIRPMGDVLKIISNTSIDNVQSLAKMAGHTDYACWTITETLKRNGLLEESTPYKLTTKGIEVLEQL